MINFVTLEPADLEDWQFRFEGAAGIGGDFDSDGRGLRGSATALKRFGVFDLSPAPRLKNAAPFMTPKAAASALTAFKATFRTA